MGSFISRALIMVLGYAYPAYECFKAVEKKEPEIEQLLFWCKYWILIALLAVCERVGDPLISWLPLYGEAKLVFVIYLSYSKSEGTAYVYDSYVRPFVAKHQTEIELDRIALLIFFQEVVTYVLMGFSKIFKSFYSQATSDVNHSDPADQTKDKET